MDVCQLPNLTFDYAALEPRLSGRIIELHHDKHHRAYVEGANATIEKLAIVRQSADFNAIWKIVDWTNVAQRFASSWSG